MTFERDDYGDLPRYQHHQLPDGDMAAIETARRNPRPFNGFVRTDETTCPGCWSHITADLLCECDNDTGPLCTNRCCGFWHAEEPPC